MQETCQERLRGLVEVGGIRLGFEPFNEEWDPMRDPPLRVIDRERPYPAPQLPHAACTRFESFSPPDRAPSRSSKGAGLHGAGGGLTLFSLNC